jgi:translation elongation factor EF-Tu-like GTPase
MVRMDFGGYNLRRQNYDDAMAAEEKALDLTVDRARVAYGTQGAAVGFLSSQGT